MCWYRFIFIPFVWLFCYGLTFAQGVNIGIPPIWNFTKKTYKAGTQNWDIAQDHRGIMYWANNEGLLQYNGAQWTCLPVPNGTIVRSVAIASDGRIYIGAQSEIGYFLPASNGKLVYHSLVNLLPASQRSFEDVWDICLVGKEVFFRTNDVVFQYANNNIQIHRPGGTLTAMFQTPQGLFLQQNLTQLLVFQQGTFAPFLRTDAIQSALTGFIPWYADTLLFATLKNGLFFVKNRQIGQWVTPHDPLLKEKRVYAATALPNGFMALGTSLSGVIVLDKYRRVFRHLNKKDGLQNNNILSIYSDKAGNLWLGLDRGIDCVALTSRFSTITPDGDLEGTGYAATVFRNELYLGVSNGLYVLPWKSFYNQESGPLFKKINHSEGQVWSLKAIGGRLLMGHHEGAFDVAGGSASIIHPEHGAWTFVPLNEQYLLGGTYTGLVLFRKSGNEWVVDGKIKGLNESCRIMVKDADSSIWVSHPYRGLYRVEWSPKQKYEPRITFYNAKNGLPSDLNNYVFQVAGKAVFGTSRGIYRYSQTTQSFVPDPDFNRILGSEHRIKYLKEDTRGNIWFASDKETGLLMVEDFGLKKETRKRILPELDGKLVGGFEFIYPIDDYNVVIGCEQGFMYYYAGPGLYSDTTLQVVISQVIAGSPHGDSLLFDGALLPGMRTPASMPVLHARWNNLRFVFAATDYQNPEFIEFRVRLKGLEENWSAWSPETQRDYTNLSASEYTFELQARRKDGLESQVVTYSFRIQPPWYASIVAWVFYSLTFIGALVWFLFWQHRKYETEKQQLKDTHQQKEEIHLKEVERSKAALSEVQNEKLEAEIRFKNQELASATMHLVQKGEILLTIQEALNQILEQSTNPAVKKEIQYLLNLLNFDAKLDEDWEQFAYHFDQVHVNFLKRLRERFPQLSSNDYKLCAYLRMNLTTKEIASLMNVSVRGVETSRYRLRKKLNLPNDTNLTDFILVF